MELSLRRPSATLCNSSWNLHHSKAVRVTRGRATCLPFSSANLIVDASPHKFRLQVFVLCHESLTVAAQTELIHKYELTDVHMFV